MNNLKVHVKASLIFTHFIYVLYAYIHVHVCTYTCTRLVHTHTLHLHFSQLQIISQSHKRGQAVCSEVH